MSPARRCDETPRAEWCQAFERVNRQQVLGRRSCRGRADRAEALSVTGTTDVTPRSPRAGGCGSTPMNTLALTSGEPPAEHLDRVRPDAGPTDSAQVAACRCLPTAC